jgi:hypothetical protein
MDKLAPQVISSVGEVSDEPVAVGAPSDHLFQVV